MNEATKLGHTSAQIAADHADKVNDNWSVTAYQLFCEYAKTHNRFTTEQARLHYTTFDKPPSNRAWGGIALKAQANKVVKSVGLIATKNRTAHGANATLWESQILDTVTKCRLEFQAKYGS